MTASRIDRMDGAFARPLEDTNLENTGEEPISGVREVARPDSYAKSDSQQLERYKPPSHRRRKPVRGPSISVTPTATPRLTLKDTQDLTFRVLDFLGYGSVMESQERSLIREAITIVQQNLAEYQEMGSLDNCLNVLYPLRAAADICSRVPDYKDKGEVIELADIEEELYMHVLQFVNDAQTLYALDDRSNMGNLELELTSIERNTNIQLDHLRKLKGYTSGGKGGAAPATPASHTGGTPSSSGGVAAAAGVMRPAISAVPAMTLSGGMASVSNGPVFRAPVMPKATPFASAALCFRAPLSFLR